MELRDGTRLRLEPVAVGRWERRARLELDEATVDAPGARDEAVDERRRWTSPFRRMAVVRCEGAPRRAARPAAPAEAAAGARAAPGSARGRSEHAREASREGTRRLPATNAWGCRGTLTPPSHGALGRHRVRRGGPRRRSRSMLFRVVLPIAASAATVVAGLGPALPDRSRSARRSRTGTTRISRTRSTSAETSRS